MHECTNARMQTASRGLALLHSFRRAFVPSCILALCLAAPVWAQASRLAILQAEDRRAPTAQDLATIRAGLRSQDGQTARVAVRALGRLERPPLAAEVVPSLKHPLPEVRAEAANAIAQSLHGAKKDAEPGRPLVAAAMTALTARLTIEADPSVRAAICEALGRLPYAAAEDIDRVERAILDNGARQRSVVDRLGVAQGLYGLSRRQRLAHPPSAEAHAALIGLMTPRPNEALSGARVRRLAVETLLDASVLPPAAADPDAQVRRLAMHAAAVSDLGAPGWDALTHGLADESPIVRLEAVHGVAARMRDESCALLVASLKDRDAHVDLAALDGLARCGESDEAVSALVRTASDLAQADSPRGWHRAAHAIVALASASPERAAASLPSFTGSRVWQLRLYAARAATTLKDSAALEKLARDDNDNVVEAAIDGLSRTAGHAADALYIAALSRGGNQATRAGARALDGAPSSGAAAALDAALTRLEAEARDNSHDARDAIAQALATLGAPVRAKKPRVEIAASELTADDLRRLAAPRARVTIRGIGTFELALFGGEAPASIVRFARLAEAGYYNGLTFHRVVPNFVVQGGSPGANEYVGDASFMRDEVGLWPHVRGAVGISTRGHDTGDAQIFIDLVDNPRLDHDYTVFAQVLNGIEIVDQILEGDTIDRIEIVAGS
jgi:cyclophilin family peptidyl-prolyl cis-trans isomerase